MPEKPANQPTSTVQPEPQVQSTNWYKIILFILLGLLFLGAAFYTGLKFKITDQLFPSLLPLPSPLTGTPLVSPSISALLSPPQTSMIPVPTIPSNNRVFYEQDNNVFSYDIQIKEVINWTNYPKNPDRSPSYDSAGKEIPNISIYSNNIKLINENTLGFAKCAIIKGDFGCGLYTLNLKTKEVSEVKKLDKSMLLSEVGWFSPNKFAYLVTAPQWQLYLSNNGVLKVLETLRELYGRGGFIEDSSKLSFSPNGEYLLQISTSSPRKGEDFNIYLYKVSDASKQVISEATQPDWLDNQRIIYRKYGSQKGDGLYIYDLGSQKSEKISIIENDAYHPQVLTGTNKILYETYPRKQVWLYDTASQQKNKLVESALGASWVNPSTIAYSEIAPCSGNEECGMLDYQYKAVAILNLDSNQKIGNIPGLTWLSTK